MYILEGNIGAGKTTFLSFLKKHLPEVKVHFEPVDNWNSSIYGNSLLANFYENPKRWAYTMETLTMVSRAQQHLEIQKDQHPFLITERSIYSGHYCFAVNGRKNGFFTEIEWNIYNQWINFLINNQFRTPKGFIYLRVNPQVCFERIKLRNRLSEKTTTLSYIKQIHAQHEQFLIEKRDLFESIKNVPVLKLDCDQDFVKNEQALEKLIYKLKNFLEITSSTQIKTEHTEKQLNSNL